MKTSSPSAIALLSLAPAAYAADPSAPGNKPDDGSPSQEANEASPSTKPQGEDAPVASATSGASPGETARARGWTIFRGTRG